MITLVNPTLPYAFAKRHGVVLLDAGEITSPPETGAAGW